MAEKPKPKPKPKRRPRSKPHFDDRAQSERFIEAARELGIEEAGTAFDDAFMTIAPPKGPS
jgi:hypothetical protein